MFKPTAALLIASAGMLGACHSDSSDRDTRHTMRDAGSGTRSSSASNYDNRSAHDSRYDNSSRSGSEIAFDTRRNRSDTLGAYGSTYRDPHYDNRNSTGSSVSPDEYRWDRSDLTGQGHTMHAAVPADEYKRDRIDANSSNRQHNDYAMDNRGSSHRDDASLRSTDRPYAETYPADRSTTSSDRDRMYAEQRGNMNNQSLNSVAADAKVLSILHCKNLEEVELGRLAQQKAQSSSARDFAKMMVDDHSSNDEKVMKVARESNINLLGKEESKQLFLRDMGMDNEMNRKADPVSELRNLSGAEFDRAYAQKMVQGHRDLIRELETLEPTIQDKNVRDLVKKTLTTIRQHESHATKINP